MKSLKFFLSVISLMLLAWGCASGVTVKTNGFLDRKGDWPSVASGSRIYVQTSSHAENPLFDQEIAGKIKQLLQNDGYAVSAKSDAQFSLAYAYEMDQGLTVTETVSEYHPGDVLYHSGRFKVNGQEGTYSNYETTPGYITHVPVDTVVYTRKLVLTVHDIKDADARPVWIGESFSQGTHDDLREMIDYLLVGAFRSFGKDTQKSLRTVIPFNDPEVMMLRGRSAQ
ncbi:MAG: hypothetical protein JNN05_00985 [Candidatus Omnitrophica bacterium]|nr:hypothetical protein [Candidatus Omnitrophota bacterium]